MTDSDVKFAVPAEAAACLREYIRVGSMRSTTEDRELNARAALESLEAEVASQTARYLHLEQVHLDLGAEADARIRALESELAEKTARVAAPEADAEPVQDIRFWVEAFGEEIERSAEAMAARDRGGQQVEPSSADFAHCPPSTIGRLRRWLREFRGALPALPSEPVKP